MLKFSERKYHTCSNISQTFKIIGLEMKKILHLHYYVQESEQLRVSKFLFLSLVTCII